LVSHKWRTEKERGEERERVRVSTVYAPF